MALLRQWHPEATENDIRGMLGRHIEEERRREDGDVVWIPVEREPD
jgi:hypothetical protein